MQNTVEAILARLDRKVVDSQVASIAEKESKLKEIEARISADKTPILDRLNVFKTTDAEKDLAHLKNDRKEVQQELVGIRGKLVSAISDAVANEPAARLAIRLSELDTKLEDVAKRMSNLSIEQSVSSLSEGAADQSNFEISGMETMRESFRTCRGSFDDLASTLRQQIGIEFGLTENSLVEATLKKLAL